MINFKKKNKKIDFVRPKIKSLLMLYLDIAIIARNSILSNDGPFLRNLQLKLSKFLESDKTIVFANGHIALETTIKSYCLQGEAITTAFTFSSTTLAIMNCGLTPIFCDIDINDYNIDVSKIESYINENTVAIIPVHVFGNPCDVYEIERIAKKHKLIVIYDAAHAFGTKIDNIPISKFGNASMFSFHATKVYNSMEGGAIVVNENDNVAKIINSLKNFGYYSSANFECVGSNGKMHELTAAVGLRNFQWFPKELKLRSVIFDIYEKELGLLEGLRIPKRIENITPNYSYYVILITATNKNRDDLYAFLSHNYVVTKKYFYPLTTDISFKFIKEDYKLPNAKYVVERTLALPIYASLRKRDAYKVAKLIKEYMLS